MTSHTSTNRLVGRRETQSDLAVRGVFAEAERRDFGGIYGGEAAGVVSVGERDSIEQ